MDKISLTRMRTCGTETSVVKLLQILLVDKYL